MTADIRPFRIETSDAALDDLRQRLANTRWPEAETVSDWSQGIPLDYMQEVCSYWARQYDWRATEARINALPQFKTAIDGLDIHFLHIRSPHAAALPLLMTHGWPGSIMEFQSVIAPLTDPVAHGGAGSDAFHLVLPSLPGFGFSAKPAKSGWNVDAIAAAWVKLMQRLGYQRYAAQGGDWGSPITLAVGTQDREHCLGIHTTMPIVAPDPATMDDLTDQERDALAGREHYDAKEIAYALQQSTRPQTLGYSLVDSPAGQAAWILEKFYAWTDCDGHPENVVSRDQLLDNVMMYWLPGTAASSGRLYWESFRRGGLPPIDVASGCSMFPKEIVRSSRRWVEKRFTKLIYWNELDRGGHFAALEQPELFVDEVRACFRLMR